MSNCRTSAPKEPQILNLSSCQEITGAWNWFLGGEVTISPEGGLLWRQNPALAQSATAVGRWVCKDTRPRSYLLSWQNGLTDELTLSPDHQSLSGKNQTTNVVVSGSRRKNP